MDNITPSWIPQWEKISAIIVPNIVLLYRSRIENLSHPELRTKFMQAIEEIQLRMNFGNMNKALSAIHNLPLLLPPYSEDNTDYSDCQGIYFWLLDEHDRLLQLLFPGQYKKVKKMTQTWIWEALETH